MSSKEVVPGTDARETLSAVLDLSSEAIVVIDRHGAIALFGRGAEKMFGYGRREVLGRNVSILMPEPFRGEHPAYMERYLETGEKRIIGIGREVTGRRKDASEFPLHISIAEIAGEERRFLGILRDLTGVKATEDELRARREEFLLAVETAPAGVASLDLRGRLLAANPVFCDLVGVAQSELVDRDLVDLGHDSDRGAFRATLEALAAGDLDVFTHAFRFLRGDEPREGVVRCVCTREPDGSPRKILVHLEDRTDTVRARNELRVARERLAHAGRVGLLGELAAGLAHELNQPLTAISSFAQGCARLVSEGRDPDEQVRALERIQKQALRAGEVVQRVRQLATRGRRQLVAADVNELVREAVQLVAMGTETPDMEIRTDLAEGLPRVNVDRVQIQQVILNLVRNALEASRNGGASSVAIVTRATGDGVEIAVVDRGEGIPPEAADALFDPFFTTKPTGMGMGLAICQSIVREHGGRLWFTQNESSGVTFRFTVPLSEGAGA